MTAPLLSPSALDGTGAISGVGLVLAALLIGVGATACMDLWSLLLRSVFNVQSLDLGLVGRWIGHFSQGEFSHESIRAAAPVAGERVLGWCAHYSIGVLFAFVLVGGAGAGWVQAPTLWPAMFVGIVTLAAPWFVMQPAFGLGVAASKMPEPNIVRLKSFMAHAVYGVGLYGSALALARSAILLKTKG